MMRLFHYCVKFFLALACTTWNILEIHIDFLF